MNKKKTRKMFGKIIEYLSVGHSLPPVDTSCTGRLYTIDEIYQNELQHKKYNIIEELKELLKN
jgi:hypothetical protein